MHTRHERRVETLLAVATGGVLAILALSLGLAGLAIRWELRAQEAERSAAEAIERIERAQAELFRPDSRGRE